MPLDEILCACRFALLSLIVTFHAETYFNGFPFSNGIPFGSRLKFYYQVFQTPTVSNFFLSLSEFEIVGSTV